MGRPQAFVGFEVLRHADVARGVDHFSISALPSTVGDIRESMRSIKDPRVGGLRGRRVLYANFPLTFMLKT